MIFLDRFDKNIILHAGRTSLFNSENPYPTIYPTKNQNILENNVLLNMNLYRNRKLNINLKIVPTSN